ncbi:hypothetical protein [Neptuniibacter halophilus]|uniref:hypothetical protein n=1 Tax=Neptuniibacter halophilus TaxID=651666 RepID=UPI002573200B|nr:hypothetical protein [Neptuniibacter halophilus]
MSLLDQFNTKRNTQSNRVNVAITVTNYIQNPSDSSDERIIGQRVDTGEVVEVYVPKANNPNQPSVSSIRKNAAPGGAVMLAEAYVDQKASRRSQDSSYVMGCRWPRLLSPSAQEGQARKVMARIQSPFFHENGNTSMNVTVMLPDAVDVNNMESFNRAFFEALNPETTPMNANPIAGIRIIEFDDSGNALNAALRRFLPAFNDDHSPANIQTTFNQYNSEGTESNALLRDIRPMLEQAFQAPNYKVEVVKQLGFTVGTETKKSVKKKHFDNLPMNTWEVVPTMLNSGKEGEENYTGFAECMIGFRKGHSQSGSSFYMICGGMATERNGLVTRAGIPTLVDKQNHQNYLNKLSAERQQQKQNQNNPTAGHSPQPNALPEAPAFENPFPEQQSPSAHAMSTDFQAPQKQMSQQAPQMAPQQQMSQQAPQMAPQQQMSQQAPQMTPQQAAAQPFTINDVQGGEFISITPPNGNPDLEESLFTSLSTLSSNPIQQNGRWYFPIAEYSQIKEQLQSALQVVSQQHPELSGGINDMSTAAPSQPAAPTNPVKNQNPENNLDFSELGNEIDQMFSTNPKAEVGM